MASILKISYPEEGEEHYIELHKDEGGLIYLDMSHKYSFESYDLRANDIDNIINALLTNK